MPFTANRVTSLAIHRLTKENTPALQPISPRNLRWCRVLLRVAARPPRFGPRHQKPAQGKSPRSRVLGSKPSRAQCEGFPLRHDRQFKWQPCLLAPMMQGDLLATCVRRFRMDGFIFKLHAERRRRAKHHRYLFWRPLVIQFRTGLNSRLQHFPEVQLAAQCQKTGLLHVEPESLLLRATLGKPSRDIEIHVRQPSVPRDGATWTSRCLRNQAAWSPAKSAVSSISGY